MQPRQTHSPLKVILALISALFVFAGSAFFLLVFIFRPVENSSIPIQLTALALVASVASCAAWSTFKAALRERKTSEAE